MRAREEGCLSALIALALLRPHPAAAAADPFLWKSTAPLSVASVLAQFEFFDRELKTLSAHFTQSMTVANTGMSSSAEGTVAYLKPDHLRIQHLKPEPQIIISDGKELWIHRLSQNQVIESNLNDWKQADPMIGNLLQFGSYATMLKNYDVRLDDARAPTLILRPKTKQEEPFELTLTLERTRLFPEAAELSIGEMNIRTRFDSVRFNPPIEESVFYFTPPAGADVFRDFKPPKFNKP